MKISQFFAFTLGLVSLCGILVSNERFYNEDLYSMGAEFIQEMDKLEFNSQASQDKFVYTILYGLLGKKERGYYLEIGAWDPISINNTYFFEKNKKWKGISIDISADHLDRWKSVRKNTLLIEDATKCDYSTILKSFPQIIDYLTLDVDGYYTDVLKRIPFNDHIFKIITIEHDCYRFGDKYKNEEREILTSLGYQLLCGDVHLSGCSFEDWWIHPSVFPAEILFPLLSLDLNGKDHKILLETIQSSIR